MLEEKRFSSRFVYTFIAVSFCINIAFICIRHGCVHGSEYGRLLWSLDGVKSAQPNVGTHCEGKHITKISAPHIFTAVYLCGMFGDLLTGPITEVTTSS